MGDRHQSEQGKVPHPTSPQDKSPLRFLAPAAACQFYELSPKWESADRAVQTIGAFYAELCMDEREYRLTGTDALNSTDAAMADRCRLFLKTDREYEWPETPSMAVQAAVVGASVFLVLLP